MNDREMVVQLLKDVERMDHELDYIRTNPTAKGVEWVTVASENLDGLARFIVDVKRKVTAYLAGQ